MSSVERVDSMEGLAVTRIYSVLHRHVLEEQENIGVMEWA